eukprot:2924791-Alexandrium_andersonii.AAC.1
MAPREPWAWRGQQQAMLAQPPQAKPAGKGKGSKKDKDKETEKPSGPPPAIAARLARLDQAVKGEGKDSAEMEVTQDSQGEAS